MLPGGYHRGIVSPVTTVTVRVPAKVNPQLAVGPVQADGYHDVVTVHHAVSLFDEVTVAPAAVFSAPPRGQAGAIAMLGRTPAPAPDRGQFGVAARFKLGQRGSK
jgi:4-diphosphocytidyl-2-C-methyl-D-erythritol kinase